jgi:hypothetical protein
MEWNCLNVSGSRHARTRMVRMMIEKPHPKFRLSWMNTRIAWKKSISGWMIGVSWRAKRCTG